MENILRHYTTIKCVYENFYINKDFEYAKSMHESEYDNLTFRALKRQIFAALYNNTDNAATDYVNSIKSDLRYLIDHFGENDELVIVYKKTVSLYNKLFPNK
jgi:hypothetical protein